MTTKKPAEPELFPMRVLPNWRVCISGRVYESGDVVESDLLTAAEWSAWGSITPTRSATVAERDRH